MNLGELRKSLNRMSRDLDECEVMFLMLDNSDKECFDVIGFTSYITIQGHEDPIFLLGSHKAALKMIKEGRLKYNDGSKPDPDDFDISS